MDSGVIMITIAFGLLLAWGAGSIVVAAAVTWWRGGAARTTYRMSWANAALAILAEGNAEADRLAALGRYNEAWWVRSLALGESYKEHPRTKLDDLLRESPNPYAR